MDKIILIENQKTQFDKIVNFFSKYNGNYFIYPNNSNYQEFTDRIRVYLNTNYYKELREKILTDIFKCIEEFKPDIFIIDHVLVGCYNASTGLDFALRLRENGFQQPIIFLSRTLESDEKVMNELPKIGGNKIWVSKGYAGKEILQEEYFKKEVLEKIPSLLQKDEFDKIKLGIEIKINEILNSNSFDENDFKPELFSILRKILDKETIDENEKTVILNARYDNNEQRKQLFGALKGKQKK